MEGKKRKSNQRFERMLKQFMKASNQNHKYLESYVGERAEKKAKNAEKRRKRNKK
jgi:hypothetical protein